MWHNQLIEIPCFEVIRNRIRDHFTQHWYANICNSSKLEYYCQFKTEFKMEKYVECISNDKLRSELAAFRLRYREGKTYQCSPREQDLPSLLNVNGGVRISFSPSMPSI